MIFDSNGLYRYYKNAAKKVTSKKTYYTKTWDVLCEVLYDCTFIWQFILSFIHTLVVTSDKFWTKLLQDRTSPDVGLLKKLMSEERKIAENFDPYRRSTFDVKMSNYDDERRSTYERRRSEPKSNSSYRLG